MASRGGVVFNGGIRARLRLSTRNRMEFPRALVNVMFETGKLSDMAVTGVRGYCADLLLRSFRVRRLSGWEVYFCQPVISERFNYTLINQMVKSGRVWPAPAQMARICVGVIPQIHLFNFSPSSPWFPRFLARKNVMVLIGAQRRENATPEHDHETGLFIRVEFLFPSCVLRPSHTFSNSSLPRDSGG